MSSTHSRVVAAAVMLAASWIGVSPARSDAAGPCTTAGSTTTCTFASTGAEQTFVVPTGVTALRVTAIGGAGGTGQSTANPFGAGGRADRVAGTLVVTPGTRLYVEVGGSATSGPDCQPQVDCVPGFNGGGAGGSAAGGGASDVRTDPRTSATSLASRLLVAAGGGGGGMGRFTAYPGGAGGDAMQGGAGGNGPDPATGGGPGTSTAGGTGGTNRDGAGADGTEGAGGDGRYGGGGGGGGRYGGGGGGAVDEAGSAGGGGGGSDLVPAGGTSAVTGRPPSITITYSGLPTKTTLSADPDGNVAAGTRARLTATVSVSGSSRRATSGRAGAPPASGTVTFAEHGHTVPGCADETLDRSGAATCRTPGLVAGTRTFTATYTDPQGIYAPSRGRVTLEVERAGAGGGSGSGSGGSGSSATPAVIPDTGSTLSPRLTLLGGIGVVLGCGLIAWSRRRVG